MTKNRSHKLLRRVAAPYCIRDDGKFRLKHIDPGDTGELEDENKEMAQLLLARAAS